MSKALETSPEAAGEVLGPTEGLNEEKYEALLKLADRIEAITAAQTKIRLVLLKGAMPGGFIQFGEKVELSGPEAERIGANVGLSVTDIHDFKDSWKDSHGDAYTWRYVGDVSLGNRTIEKVEGRASSRDRFFGYEKGAWKELSDVKESDVRTAARRSLYKEGVKLMLGLRSLPSDPEFLQSIGLDPKKVKKVEFGGSAASGASGPAPSEERTPLLLKHVGQRKFTKKDKTEGIAYVIEDEKGTKYETFSESMAKAATTFWKSGKKVLLDWEANGRFAPKLSAISEAEATTEKEPDTEPNT